MRCFQSRLGQWSAATCAVVLLAGCARTPAPATAGAVPATPATPAAVAPASPAPSPTAIVPPTAADLALGKRADACWDPAQGTPGKEAANFLHTGWMHDNVRRLKGEVPSTEGQLKWARDTVSQRVDEAEKGVHWPTPAALKVPYTAKPPVLTGKLDDPRWNDAARLDGLYKLDFTQKIERPRTTWRLLWDDTTLYVRVDCEDTDIRAPLLPVNSNLWEHDCIELFILPDPKAATYWEIIANPAGARFQARHQKKLNEWGTTPEKFDAVPGMRLATELHAQPQGYSIIFAVPFTALPGYEQRAPAAGAQLWLMLARMDAHADGAQTRVDMYNFVPTLSWNHNIWNYAPITLSK